MSQTEQSRAQGVDATLARHGGLTYLEVPAKDIAASAAFYAAVVGWRSPGPGPDAMKFSDPDGRLIGRWITGRRIAREIGMVPYIYVDSVKTAVVNAQTCGGEVVKPTYPEGNLTVAVVRDPAGNIIGLWQEGHA